MNKLRPVVIFTVLLFGVLVFISACTKDIPYYVIEFNSMGGTDVDPVVVHQGDIIEPPRVPTKIGYTFDGWYLDETYERVFTFERPIKTQLTFYAKWTPNDYELKFISKEGYLIRSRFYEYGEDLSGVLYPSAPSEHNYTFVGWSMQIPETMPATNLIIYATYVEEGLYVLSNSK